MLLIPPLHFPTLPEEYFKMSDTSMALSCVRSETIQIQHCITRGRAGELILMACIVP